MAKLKPNNVKFTRSVGTTRPAPPPPSQATLLHTLYNPNPYSTTEQDRFGWNVSIDGNYAIVGAYKEDDASGTDSGKAYIYNVSTGALLHTLDNPNPYESSAGDNFGHSVSISGNYALVGSPKEWHNTPEVGQFSGKAYIIDVTTGNLVKTLSNPNIFSTPNGDQFGNDVSISGNYAIVASYGEDASGASASGAVHLFKTITGDWSDAALVTSISNPNTYGTAQSDFFGQSVSISGNYAIVGTPNEDDASGGNSGKAYIFNATNGNLLHTLDNPNAFSTGASDDHFGYSVAISGNYAIVGAYKEDDASGTDSGKAYIFDVTTGNLVHTLDNPNIFSTSASDNFGRSVAISGNYALVNAPYEDTATTASMGACYLFDVTTGNLVYSIESPNSVAGGNDRFGLGSIGISSTHIIVGSYNEKDPDGNTWSGVTHIFSI